MSIILRQGNALPTVGVLQVLLNRGIEETKLVKDGIFGAKTKKAVRDFQRPRRGLNPDGTVDNNTWSRLIAGTGFHILDAVDITDPDVLTTEGGDLRRTGGSPSLIGHMCNGIGHLMQELSSRMSQAGEPVVLRFYGHGAPAAMGISDGVGSVRIGRRRVYLDDSDLSSLTPGTVAGSIDQLQLLTPYFGAYSSVELHGCRVAQGRSGRHMIQHLASIWKVPVSASVDYQFAGGASTFHFEGRIYTAFPGGVSLRQWAGRLPDMMEISVP